MTTAVYELQTIVYDPRFEGVDFVRDKDAVSLFDDDNSILADFDLETGPDGRPYVRRLAPLWREAEVRLPRMACGNDYPCLGLRVPVFSERAVDALRDLLEPNGEILPLRCKIGRFFAYNVTTLLDVLDREKSDVEWLEIYRLRKVRPIYARYIHHYEFSADKLTAPVFRLPEKIADCYVTDAFVDRVHQHELKGMNLIKIWPLPCPKKPGGIAEMEQKAGQSCRHTV